MTGYFQQSPMFGRVTQDVPYRQVGILVAGLVAGGIAAYVSSGWVPPVLVIGAAAVIAIAAETYDL